MHNKVRAQGSPFLKQIAQSLLDTSEWERIWRNDPDIQRANKRFYAEWKRVEARIPPKLAENFWFSVMTLMSAESCASVLYGIRAVTAIHEPLGAGQSEKINKEVSDE